ncbi:hypothetical protein, partial [Nostoc sp. JL23]|uniref:hypothetical protein n=1 Tax=Nostoc sp. JL23 TaxID=2815394 RepID=UPI0025EAE521
KHISCFSWNNLFFGSPSIAKVYLLVLNPAMFPNLLQRLLESACRELLRLIPLTIVPSKIASPNYL